MRPPKLLTISLWVLAVASVGGYAYIKLRSPAQAMFSQGLLPAAEDGRLPEHFVTPTFALTDQNGQPFASDQLKGEIWVGFIFLTHCPTGACPTMVGKMAKLQAALPDDRVHFVSFSVDPERDTPEAMLKYVTEIGGSEVSPRWHLLVGESREAMTALARQMKLMVDEDFGHSTVFLLVDAAGNVRGVYGNEDADAMTRLQADAQRLLAE